VRLTRRLFFTERVKLDLIIESFNLLNRDKKRVLITQDGLESDTAYFVKISNLESITTRAISRFHEIPGTQPIPMLRARYNWV
jgi:hypothetical protein